ncbi:MAG TPA: hypothetical protein PKM51_03855 [Chitinophagales bacterium]|nr:hypothetical protein [Chitinophagales bacterium]HNM31862.1 hypothetical protein [Chitinophagales bacterium]
MVSNKFILGVVAEVLWFAFAAIAAYLVSLPIISVVSSTLFLYVVFSIFFIITYVRFIAFMSYSVLMENVFFKIGLFIVNVPLFFYLMNLYFKFGRAYDEYNYTLPANVFQHIKSGTELEDLTYIKKLITLSGSASLTVLLLMEITIVYAIFKYRQLDKYIKKNSNTES